MSLDECTAFRRRGFSADVRRQMPPGGAMRHALEVAARKHGEAPTFLHATDAGRPIYERMGYTSIATHTIFMEKRFLTGH